MDLRLPTPLRSALDLLWAHPGLAAVPLAVLTGWLLDLASVEQGPTLCVSRLLFGLPCGGCGLTRATVALAHGQWRAALHYNLLAPLWWSWAIGWWLRSVYNLARRRPMARTPSWVGLTMLMLLAVFWATRMVTFFAAPGWQQQVGRDALLLRALHAVRIL